MRLLKKFRCRRIGFRSVWVGYDGRMIETPARVYNYRIVENSLIHQYNPNGSDWAEKRIENIGYRIEDCEKIEIGSFNDIQKSVKERNQIIYN